VWRVALPPLIALCNRDGLDAITVAIDWRVLLSSFGVVCGAALVCAALPALKIHRASVRGEAQRLAATRFSAGPLERRLRAANRRPDRQRRDRC
jgi:hypothetical protein